MYDIRMKDLVQLDPYSFLLIFLNSLIKNKLNIIIADTKISIIDTLEISI